MLRKLFKYDFCQIGKPIVFCSVVTLIITAFGTLFLRIVTNLDYSETLLYSLLTSTSNIFIIFTVIALCAYPLLCFIFILRRYYKNFFTDEGYLTFTLPTDTYSLLMSKIMSGLLWGVISSLVQILCISLILFFGPVVDGVISVDWIVDFVQSLKEVMDYYPLFTIILFIVNVIVGLIGQYLAAYFAITIGSIAAKKHKILVAFLIYFGITNVFFIMVTVVFVTISFVFMTTDYTTAYAVNMTEYIGLSSVLLLSMAFAVVMFVLNNRLLKNKLNLE